MPDNSIAQRILVTGGLGYIGCRLVPALIESGYQVRVLDLALFGNHLNTNASASSPLEIVRGDIRNPNTLQRALDGIDGVIHLAAMSNDPSAELDEELTRATNLDASLNLIRLARTAGAKRFLNASSATVYGVKGTPGVTEEASHEPISLYGKYKSEIDKHLASESSAAFAGTNIRAATVCGWSPRLRLDLTVNIFTAHCCTNKVVRVFGGEQKRPNVVIDDLVRAYITLLKAPTTLVSGESFNVCASNYSVLEIARRVIAAVNPEAELRIEPVVDHRSYDVSAEKIGRILGFNCAYDISDGAQQVANAFLDGRIRDASSDIYVNVAHLLRIGVATHART